MTPLLILPPYIHGRDPKGSRFFVLKSEMRFWQDCCIIWRFHVLEKIHKNVKVTPSGSAPKEK